MFLFLLRACELQSDTKADTASYENVKGSLVSLTVKQCIIANVSGRSFLTNNPSTYTEDCGVAICFSKSEYLFSMACGTMIDLILYRLLNCRLPSWAIYLHGKPAGQTVLLSRHNSKNGWIESPRETVNFLLIT